MEDKFVEVYEREDKVILGTPGGNAVFDPPTAVDLAKSLLDCAARLGCKIEVKVPKREVSPAMRAVLIGRITRVVQSQRSDNISAGHSAMSIVDIILSEIA